MRTAAPAPWLIAALVVAALSTGACDPTGETVAETVENPPPDPMAPCREFLDGHWGVPGDWLRIEFDGEASSAVVWWDNSFQVVPGAFVECHDDRAVLTAKGYTGTVEFDGDDHIVAHVPTVGEIMLTRRDPPDDADSK